MSNTETPTCPKCDGDARAYYEGPEFGCNTLFACPACRHSWVNDE